MLATRNEDDFSDDEEKVEELKSKIKSSSLSSSNRTTNKKINSSLEKTSISASTSVSSPLPPLSLSTTSTEKTSQSSLVSLVNREEKIEEYKHIKPLSIDDISRGGRISYPSLDDILSTSNNNSWMSMVLPSAPPLLEEEQVTYPHLSDLSNQTLQYILPPIIVKKDDEKEIEPVLPPLVVHKIQEGETLISISIKYGVTEESIKMRNRMMDSDLTLYNKTELQIPEPTQLPSEDSFKKKELTEDERRKIEERKKAWTLTLFMKLCNVGEDEARYYLSIHDFDFKEAIQEHKSDLEWEREHNEKLSKKKRKKKIDNFLDENPKVMGILRFLSFCIPNTNTRRKNKDVELDLIQDDVINYDSDY